MPTAALIRSSDTFFSSRLGRLLLARGIATLEEAESFLTPNYEEHLFDPFLLHDMKKAVDIVLGAMERKERIAIFSDYDCDGIPGAVILHDCFTALCYENFETYIPHRHFEGFGLNTDAIDILVRNGVSLIITVDCGINDAAAIAYAVQKGVTIIVTDHHEPPKELPPAAATIDPKLGDYPFPDLCGSAVVFKLAQALLKSKPSALLPPGQEKWWLDMVGLATIADMVPLRGENRVFAHFGLTVLRRARRPGVRELLRRNRLKAAYLSEDDIGFTIAPRINAASRMDAPQEAFFLLSAKSDDEAARRAERLEKLNNERRAAVAVMTRELHDRLRASDEELPPVLVFGSPAWRPALAGLAANKLAEEHDRPAFLWGRDGNGIIKGSCRAGGEVSVLALMQEASPLFIEYGGHHFSGGFSVREECIHTLAGELNAAFVRLGERARAPKERVVDLHLSLEEVDDALLFDLKRLSPFGAGNPKPLFSFANVTPSRVESFGKGKEHLKLLFPHGRGTIEAVAFFASPETFSREPKAGETTTLLAHVEESYFLDRPQVRLRIIDLL